MESDINSGGGTLNRLIEIYVTKNVIKNGIETCNVINENYGHAGETFIAYLKDIDKEELQKKFIDKYNELMALDKTEEKQAINMAMLLLADQLACECIFLNEEPLKAEEVVGYMFSKTEIDNTERAYEMFNDECEINSGKFEIVKEGKNISNAIGEFWGIKDEYEITIVSQKLRDILRKNGFNYNKIIKGWAEKGYIEKNAAGKYSTHLSRNGTKANYIIVKVRSSA